MKVLLFKVILMCLVQVVPWLLTTGLGAFISVRYFDRFYAWPHSVSFLVKHIPFQIVNMSHGDLSSHVVGFNYSLFCSCLFN